MFRGLVERFRQWRIDRGAYEPADPVAIEVLHDGAPIALLTERAWEDMFWRSYKIEPTDSRALDDSLWETCAFTFRDTTNGAITTSFVGGQRPFIRDHRITLRVMVFQRPMSAALPRAKVR